MKRRDFLKTAGALSVMPKVTFGYSDSPIESTFPGSIMSASMSPSSGRLEVLQGQLPSDITGHIFMAEGIPLEEDHLSPNGRGALTRVDFSANGADFTRKMIDTPSAIMQEHATGLLDKFYLLGGTIYYSPNMGFMNYCNTAPNYMGDNRFALSYEGGIPFEFDATSLELVTPIGQVDEWRTSLPPIADFFTPDKWFFPQVRTTGHPFFDLHTGESFTINYGGNVGTTGTRNGFIRLIKWDMQGAFKAWNIVSREGDNAYLVATAHSMGVTRNHILVFETAARVETTRIIGTKIVTPQQHKTPVWIIRKSDLVEGRDHVVADYLELDFDTSDVMCNYDDHQGEISIYGQYLGAMDKSEPQFACERLYFGGRVPDNLAGYPVAPVDVGGLVRVRIQVTSSGAREINEDFRLMRDERLLWDMNDPAYRGHFQFPETFEHIYWAAIGYRPEHLVTRVADAYADYPNRMYQNHELPGHSIPSSLVHMDCRTMNLVDAYQFPDDCVMRTPQFMARLGTTGQDEGYIFTAVVRKSPTAGRGNGKEFWIFDAQDLTKGPVCILGHAALDFATTNHALWVPTIGPRPEQAYKADMASYFNSKLDKHSRQVKEIVQNHILPRFG